MVNNDSWRLKQKLRLGNIISTRLNLGYEDKNAVKFMIKTINFKHLHRRAGNETIIAALCYYCMKTRKTNLSLESYPIFEEYGLDYKVYSTIVTHLANYYQKRMLQKYVNF